MLKRIMTYSLCCSCLLYGELLDNTKKVFDNTSENINKSVVTPVKEKYNNYNKEQEEKKNGKINSCIKEIETDLPNYALFLEQYYLKVNKNAEDKVLINYEQLKKDGFSSELKSYVDKDLLEKLSNSKNLIEYSNIILASYKSVQEELKKNDKKKINSLIKKIEFLMFAWTTPFEIYSTKKIYDKSLLDITNKTFINIDKTKYNDYTKFLYSLMISNMINENITIKKDTTISGISIASLNYFSPISLAFIHPTAEDKKGLEIICKELIENTYFKSSREIVLENLASSLRIEKDSIVREIDKILKNDNLFEGSVVFNNKNIELEKIDFVNNPLQDGWYFMIREYIEIQNDFYNNKKEIEKIIVILNDLPDAEKEISILKENIFKVDSLYRKFDEIVRFNIIDLPILIYSDLYSIELQKAKTWYKDDDKHIAELAVSYNKSCANLQKYMVNSLAIGKVLEITKEIKSEFNESEWEEVITRAKLTQDWLDMLNKVKIENK